MWWLPPDAVLQKIGWSLPVPSAQSAALTGWPPASWLTPASPASSWFHFVPPPRHCSPGTWRASVETNPGCAPGGPWSKPKTNFLDNFFNSSGERRIAPIHHIQHWLNTSILSREDLLKGKEKIGSDWSAKTSCSGGLIPKPAMRLEASWKEKKCQWKSAARAESIRILHSRCHC